MDCPQLKKEEKPPKNIINRTNQSQTTHYSDFIKLTVDAMISIKKANSRCNDLYKKKKLTLDAIISTKKKNAQRSNKSIAQ